MMGWAMLGSNFVNLTREIKIRVVLEDIWKVIFVIWYFSNILLIETDVKAEMTEIDNDQVETVVPIFCEIA